MIYQDNYIKNTIKNTIKKSVKQSNNTIKRKIHYGAINTFNNLYTPLDYASKTETYMCSDENCNNPLVYCDGAVNVAYFRHKFSENEKRCELTNNPDYATLLTAKNTLNYILKNKNIEILKTCKYCLNPVPVVKINELYRNIAPNYRILHNDFTVIIDIALLDQQNEPIHLIDIIHTSKIPEARPEKSFVFDAKTIKELDLSNDTITLCCIKKIIICETCILKSKKDEDRRLNNVVKINYDIAIRGLEELNEKRSYFEELEGRYLSTLELKQFIEHDKCIDDLKIQHDKCIDDLKIQQQLALINTNNCNNEIWRQPELNDIDVIQKQCVLLGVKYEPHSLDEEIQIQTQLLLFNTKNNDVIQQPIQITERQQAYSKAIVDSYKTLLYIFKNKTVVVLCKCNGMCGRNIETNIPLSTDNRVLFNYYDATTNQTTDFAVLDANNKPLAFFLYYYSSDIIYPDNYYGLSAYNVKSLDRHKKTIILNCKLNRNCNKCC